MKLNDLLTLILLLTFCATPLNQPAGKAKRLGPVLPVIAKLLHFPEEGLVALTIRWGHAAASAHVHRGCPKAPAKHHRRLCPCHK